MTSLLNDRLVVKGTVQEVLTIFFQVGSASTRSSAHSNIREAAIIWSSMRVTATDPGSAIGRGSRSGRLRYSQGDRRSFGDRRSGLYRTAPAHMSHVHGTHIRPLPGKPRSETLGFMLCQTSLGLDLRLAPRLPFCAQHLLCAPYFSAPHAYLGVPGQGQHRRPGQHPDQGQGGGPAAGVLPAAAPHR